MYKEFKEFIMRGNVVDLAVGVVIGGAFGSIVSSLVEDIIMPPIGVLLGKVDFSNLYILIKPAEDALGAQVRYPTLADARAAGAVTMNIGLFLNAVISFLIVALAVFLLVKAINKLRRQEEEAPAAPTTKACPYCCTDIPLEAVRCPHCTSELKHAE